MIGKDTLSSRDKDNQLEEKQVAHSNGFLKSPNKFIKTKFTPFCSADCGESINSCSSVNHHDPWDPLLPTLPTRPGGQITPKFGWHAESATSMGCLELWTIHFVGLYNSIFYSSWTWFLGKMNLFLYAKEFCNLNSNLLCAPLAGLHKVIISIIQDNGHSHFW